MKQFNLDEYIKDPSRKVVTRDGRIARIVCTDRVSEKGYLLLALVMTDGHECVYTYNTYGQFYSGDTNHALDLFFAPEKHEGWLNVYRHTDTGEVTFGAILHTSREEAEKIGRADDYYAATAKIEWEE